MMLLCLLSGALTGLTFVFKELCFLNIITLIPLLLSLKNGKKTFLKGFLYYASLNAASMSFFYSMHPLEFMGLTGFKSMLLVLLMYAGVVVFEGVVGGLLTLLFCKFIKKDYLFPLWYTLCEIILSVGTFGLTFSCIYLSFYKMLPFIQSAAYLGCYFITFLVVVINFLLFKCYETKKLLYLVIAVTIIILNTVFGVIRINCFPDASFDYNLALIQGNVSTNEKWEQGSIDKTVAVYKELSEDAVKKYNIDGIIWPETVVNTFINESGQRYTDLSDFAKKIGCELYTGIFYASDEGLYNALVAFDKNGKSYPDKYYKRHLIPFAEESFGNDMLSINKGKKATVLNTGLGKIGPMICIDSAYPQLADKNYKDCDYLLVISNDSWFKDSFGVENHFAHSVFRAIENNKYLLRVGNSGITAFVTPKGKVKGEIAPQKKGYTVIKKGEVYREEK